MSSIPSNLGVSIVPVKSDVNISPSTLLAPSGKYRPISYPTSNEDDEDDVGSEIALSYQQLGHIPDNDLWLDLPLARKIGIPLRFKMWNDGKNVADSQQPENMFAEIMYLKTDRGDTYYPVNPRENQPIYGGIVVERSDNKSLKIQDIQAIWDYIHSELRTSPEFKSEPKLLPRSYSNALKKYELTRDPKERWRDGFYAELMKGFDPKDNLSKANAARRKEKRFPQPEELRKITKDDKCWVADRKYVFEVLREQWQTNVGSDAAFFKFWKEWKADMARQVHKDYKNLECPVPEPKSCLLM
jgi:hypothetical protein